MNLGELEISIFSLEKINLLDPIVPLYIPNVDSKENLSTFAKMFLISLKLTGLLKFTLFGYPKDGPPPFSKMPNMMEKVTYSPIPLNV